MEIAGIQKNSFVDYPASISAVIFTPGCNFNCWYCHNREIINETEGGYNEDAVLDFLKERVGFLDAVVITGGEPTLQKDLVEFVIKIKEIGYKIKLDTNGTNPLVLEKLLELNLLDYVAMDIKASFEKYRLITPIKNKDIIAIKKSVKLIKRSSIEYEFRTTFAPNLKIDDIKNLLNQLGKIKSYSLQLYIKPKYIEVDKLKNHEKCEFEEIRDYAKEFNLVENFNIKNFD